MARPRAAAPTPIPVPFLLILLGCHSCAACGGGGGGIRGSSVYPASVVYPHHSRQISWHPRAFLYPHFLSDDEANHLVSLASGTLKPSVVLKKSAVANKTSGKSMPSEVRASSGYFIGKGKDPIVAGIEDKIAAWTFLPKENGEDMQVMRYKRGEKYERHYDYFTDSVNTIRGGQRVATVLLYLTDVAEGGETVFPLAKERMALRNKDTALSECARSGMAVRPRKGDALLFFNLRPDAATDPSSLHGGCTVVKGEKWFATKWLRVASYDKAYHAPGGNCTDGNDSCGRWAALGECSKNPAYMVGTVASPGHCRRSCNVC